MRIDNMQNFYDILKGISEYSKASAFSWNEKDTLKKVSFEHFFDDVKTVMTMMKGIRDNVENVILLSQKNYFSTNHTWEFEECQIILKKSKKEAPTVIVSACKILYSFFSGKIIPVFICSIVQTCKLFYCKIFQWIFFIYHNSYSIFSNDFCFQKLCFIIL